MVGHAQRFVSRSSEDTQRIGEVLGARLRPRDVVACIGELGAGKTCFLQGLLRGLGVKEAGTSPTFILVNQYQGRLPVYHLDAYRTESLTEILDLGVEEMFWGDGVTVIEWGDKLLPLLPSHAILVRIAGLGEEPREIVLERLSDAPACIQPGTLTPDGSRATECRTGGESGEGGTDHQLARGRASP